MNSVKLIYNPYIQEMKVYINDIEVSEYSSIVKYIYTPFNKWCRGILDEIYHEVNDDFYLIVKSGIFENQIMEKLSNDYLHCIGFSSEEFDINIPIYERIMQLNNLVGNYIENKNIYLEFCSEEEYLVDSMKEILENSGIFYYNEDFNTLTCEDYPMCNLLIKENNEIYEDIKLDNIKIYICNGSVDESILSKLKSYQNTVFMLNLGSENKFLAYDDNIYMYEVQGSDIVEFITFIVEEYILNKVLNEIYIEVNTQMKEGRINIKENDIEVLKSSISINPSYKVKCEKSIYLGRSTPIEVITYPYNNYDVEYYFKYDIDGIILINNKRIETIRPGRTNVYMYNSKSKELIDTFKITVLEKKLVSDIIINHKSKCMACGTKYQLEWTYYPLEAENINEIMWKSSNETIAQVDNNGNIVAINKGVCTIIAYTEEIEKSIDIIVQPRLKHINIPQSYIEARVGENIEFKYTLDPDDCFEKESIKIWCSDESVISYRGEYITALKQGESKLIIYTENDEFSRECRVKVNKPKLFRIKR